jgi:hypothetical protein
MAPGPARSLARIQNEEIGLRPLQVIPERKAHLAPADDDDIVLFHEVRLAACAGHLQPGRSRPRQSRPERFQTREAASTCPSSEHSAQLTA